ncbi:MAG: hypothetical protein CM1200mP10_26820 [Candidatus Neomarinimicrobiota bacterium]|nr:MAG: hypothetical protein CM1200mP10_26820 [Candidatus Neomarinimicrobiota bacterium]
MALTIAERFKYNLYLWYFGLTQVRLIHYCRPKIVDITEEKVVLMMSLDRRTRNHVRSMYIGAMVVGVDMVTGFTAMVRIRESKRKVIPIFKDLTANFLKRAEGDVYFICREGKAITEAVEKTIQPVKGLIFRYKSLPPYQINLQMNQWQNSLLLFQ